MNLSKGRMHFQKRDPFFDPRVPAFQRIGPHRSEIYSLFYGTLFGDAYAEKHGFGTRIHFHQSSRNIEYLYWLHKNVAQYGYCSPNMPKLIKQVGKQNKVYYSLKFRTWTFRSLNSLYDDWYDETRRKILPLNLQNYLNPLSFSYLIMDNGSFTGYGLKIATDSFTKEEVYRLQSCIEEKFKFKTSVHVQKQKWRLYIPKTSFAIMVPLVKPHFCPSMLYKLNKIEV